jgi:hypothetical protein
MLKRQPGVDGNPLSGGALAHPTYWQSRSQVAPASRNFLMTCPVLAKLCQLPCSPTAQDSQGFEDVGEGLPLLNEDEDDDQCSLTEGEGARLTLLTLHAREEAEYFDCLAVCLTRMEKLVLDILYVYDCNRPLASYTKIKDGAVCGMMFINYLLVGVEQDLNTLTPGDDADGRNEGDDDDDG